MTFILWIPELKKDFGKTNEIQSQSRKENEADRITMLEIKELVRESQQVAREKYKKQPIPFRVPGKRQNIQTRLLESLTKCGQGLGN